MELRVSHASSRFGSGESSERKRSKNKNLSFPIESSSSSSSIMSRKLLLNVILGGGRTVCLVWRIRILFGVLVPASFFIMVLWYVLEEEAPEALKGRI
uniref:Uncharacterized protein n=1 Tax=Lepeophtheirus salmonis TaxID=72036 RepID=A0A0K2V8H4_LEPSM